MMSETTTLTTYAVLAEVTSDRRPNMTLLDVAEVDVAEYDSGAKALEAVICEAIESYTGTLVDENNVHVMEVAETFYGSVPCDDEKAVR